MPSSKRCLLYIASEEYKPFVKVSVESFQDTSSSDDYDVVVIPGNNAKEIYEKRPVEVLNCFTAGYEQVLFLGADVVFYQDSYYLFDMVNGHDVMVTPHKRTFINHPEKVAWTRLTGLYNSDFVLWNNTHASEEFLNWQASMLKDINIGAPKEGFFFDQSYLDYLPVHCKTLINMQFSQNVAWYNYTETTERDIKSFQFSGYNPNKPTTLSKYEPIEQQLKQPLHITKLALDYQSRLLGAGWKPKTS